MTSCAHGAALMLRAQSTHPIVGVLVIWLAGVSPASGQTLVDLDAVPSSGLTLDLRRYVQIPADPGGVTPRMTSFTTQPGDPRLFVASHGYDGPNYNTARIYAINPTPSGGLVSLYLDVGQVLDGVNGPLAGRVNSMREGGLKSVAFHPDFNVPGSAGYRKFYTSLQEYTAGGNPALPYVGTTTIADMSDSVIGEWTVGPTGMPVASSYREVLRVALDWYAHPAQSIGFNPYSRPGDEDYGLLYFSHGDAGTEPVGTGQVGTTAHGKILRVNPLADGENSYSVPATNPWVGDADPTNAIIDEAYAMGLRNATHFSWAKDADGVVRMLIGDIGHANAEEINVVEPGANYGWRLREGTFVNTTREGKGIGYGIDPLPANDADFGFTYPAAQYGHSGTIGVNGPAAAVRGGFVIDNGSDPALQGQYIFADFPLISTTKVLTASLEDLLSAKTRLDSGESPTALAPAPVSEIALLFDADDNPATPSVPMTLGEIFTAGPNYDGSGRGDVVFGQGLQGELYLMNKRNGWIYLAANTLPLGPPGDFNGDHVVDGADLAVWEDEFGLFGAVRRADADLDNDVDGADLLIWQRNLGTALDSTAATSSVPEPTGWLGAAMGFAAAATATRSNRRRRR